MSLTCTDPDTISVPPDGYHLDVTMNRAGDSCIYQYNWDTAGNGGAGTYTFSVTGADGTSLSFTADLNCP